MSARTVYEPDFDECRRAYRERRGLPEIGEPERESAAAVMCRELIEARALIEELADALEAAHLDPNWPDNGGDDDALIARARSATDEARS